MAEYKEQFSLEVMSRIFQVSRSGFYDWLKRPPSDRQIEDVAILKEIVLTFENSDKTYGSPRIRSALKRTGISTSKRRIERLMRDHGLKSCYNTVRKPRTTDSRHDNPVSPNLLKRNFQVSAANKVWVSDITYIATDKGWVYLCMIKDLYSAAIVGYSLSYSLNSSFVIDALHSAVQRRSIEPGLIFHSDRGVQYTSKNFRKALSYYKIKSSMSRKGDCYDNAPAESFFATLKKERVRRRHYKNLDEVKKDLFKYIEIFYNRKRIHSKLGFYSPAEFEKKQNVA